MVGCVTFDAAYFASFPSVDNVFDIIVPSKSLVNFIQHKKKEMRFGISFQRTTTTGAYVRLAGLVFVFIGVCDVCRSRKNDAEND